MYSRQQNKDESSLPCQSRDFSIRIKSLRRSTGNCKNLCWIILVVQSLTIFNNIQTQQKFMNGYVHAFTFQQRMSFSSTTTTTKASTIRFPNRLVQSIFDRRSSLSSYFSSKNVLIQFLTNQRLLSYNSDNNYYDNEKRSNCQRTSTSVRRRSALFSSNRNNKKNVPNIVIPNDDTNQDHSFSSSSQNRTNHQLHLSHINGHNNEHPKNHHFNQQRQQKNHAQISSTDTNSHVIVNIDSSCTNQDDNIDELRLENQRLQRMVEELQERNMLLRNEMSNRIVLEQFEGESFLDFMVPHVRQSPNIINFPPFNRTSTTSTPPTNAMTTTLTTNNYAVGTPRNDMDNLSELWCDEVTDDGQCPIEPTISFGEALRDRAHWLVGLLILQSFSGIILARNEALLADHPFIIYFLTMLVGAGGNAGNQASVRVIRGLALGTLNEKTQNQFLVREVKMSLALSIILSFAGFIRAAAFRTPFPETIAVTASLFLIVISSICLGAVLPLLLKKLRIDPAHSSTTIQVVMDILGVLLAVTVSSTLLDSSIGKLLISKLGDGSIIP